MKTLLFCLTCSHRAWRLIVAGICLVLTGFIIASPVHADDRRLNPPARNADQGFKHPQFALLDDQGNNVLESENPVSVVTTCGACHDSQFIVSHSGHADAGLSLIGTSSAPLSHDWELGPGYFGSWNPITYRYLSTADDPHPDLSIAEWVQVFGARHVGGGPAVSGRDGIPLNDSDVVAKVAELMPSSWDWQQSGVVEMNCFLCHLNQPNNEARIAALRAGTFRWASSATLLGTGIVSVIDDKYKWNADAFDSSGLLKPEFVTVQDPTSKTCGQCHGVVHTDADPLSFGVFSSDTAAMWNTLTTGQVFSPQKILNSALNLKDKDTVVRAWDVHAERVLNCTDCHYAQNNPIYYRDTSEDKPAHLDFDPRRLDLSDYLYRPVHEFAYASSTGSTMRECSGCHNLEATHNWLPYKDQHISKLACETCHIPQLYAPAIESLDWTVITTQSQPQITYRGVDGSALSEQALLSGFQPVLLPSVAADGLPKLAPFNLISAWYWVYGEPARPVPLRDLQAVYLNSDEQTYKAEIVNHFDADKNGSLSTAELYIDTPEKQAAIVSALEARGLTSPRIVAETQPYGIHHDVAESSLAIKDCNTCHTTDSRLVLPTILADRAPGGVLPTMLDTTTDGGITLESNGQVFFYPQNSNSDAELYVFGHDSVTAMDWIGVLLFLGTLAGVFVHGGLRMVAARRHAPAVHDAHSVYMYGVYERFWHWLQTGLILGLLFTGVIIHEPDMFGALSFSFIVQVHNILALILVINAALSLFYHLTSGEIQQFLPKPRGFFNDAILQTKYYLNGIFKGEAHPFEKLRERKLNPLQQLTYLVILNILLPAQVITGALMWGIQQFPALANAFGGLPVLGPVHTLIAWAFASFVVLHVYLTTTGHTPTSNIKAMIGGWDEVEEMEPAQ
ncbi:MAG: cytochrome b/b6 domain-containing protein [Anaerolineae bacterium]|nr:cytochrome b/b6 domain-containing protein [Anaerolineae bacterium]